MTNILPKCLKMTIISLKPKKKIPMYLKNDQYTQKKAQNDQNILETPNMTKILLIPPKCTKMTIIPPKPKND